MLFDSEVEKLRKSLSGKNYNPTGFTVKDIGHGFVEYTGASKLPITVWFKKTGPEIVSGSYRNIQRSKYKAYMPLSNRSDYLLDNNTVLEVYKTNNRLSKVNEFY